MPKLNPSWLRTAVIKVQGQPFGRITKLSKDGDTLSVSVGGQIQSKSASKLDADGYLVSTATIPKYLRED